MIKLIASDLDETLLASDKSISEKNIEYIHKAIKSGVRFVVCTGRPYFRSLKTIKELGLDVSGEYTICNNGGLIKENGTNKILYEEKLNHDQIVEMVDLSEKLDVNCLVYLEDKIISTTYEEGTDFLNAYDVLFKDENGRAGQRKYESCYKMIYCGSPNKIKEVKKQIPSKFFEKYTIFQSTPFLIEIMPKGITKGKGLEELGKILNISADEMMALGDEENDLAMIEYASAGIAMSNATTAVKNAAKFITKSNNDSGVAYAIKRFIFDERESIGVSSCLLGNNVKYNGLNNYQPLIANLKALYNLVPVCPETYGGLSTPRNPSEIIGDKVIMNDGRDVTANYVNGSKISLKKLLDNNCKSVILKESSPSCGTNFIYDGTFSHVKISGMGVGARMFKENGIKVYSENNYLEKFKYL